MTTLLIPALFATTLTATPVTIVALAEGTGTEAAAAEEHPVKDAVIKSKIVGRYAMNPNVSAMNLDVKVEDGVAYLSGTAKSSTERDLAVEIARGTEGVVAVKSEISVPGRSGKSDTKPRRTVGETIDDATLTAKVKGKLIANENTPASRINVTTKNSVVTLTGTVDTSAQKDLAGALAENTEHVARVENQLTVAPR